MAFHEKAGRSQGNSGLILFDIFFSSFPAELATVAMLPSALSRSDRFARCMLGVLGSAGAAICLAPCGSALTSGTWARPLTQSPELGFGLLSFSSWTILILFCLVVLCSCRHGRSVAVVERFVHFAAHPQVMQ
jgi:hypothetical protein